MAQAEEQKLLSPVAKSMAPIGQDMERLRKRCQNEVVRGGGYSILSAQLAQELDTAWKKFGDMVDETPLAKRTKEAFNLHKFLSGMLTKIKLRVKSERSYCQNIVHTFKREAEVRAAADKRKQEADQKRSIELAREADAAHLYEMGQPEQAEELLAQPIVVAVAVTPETVEGSSSREFWDVDAISDPLEACRTVVAHPELIAGLSIEPRKLFWRAYLNRTKSDEKPELAGFSIIRNTISTNRG